MTNILNIDKNILGVSMNRVIYILGLTIMLLLTGVSISNISIGKTINDTIYVDGDGGADFTHIQNAIDAANPGDTVYVYAGNYQENIVVDKSLMLTGEDKETTIIDGGGVEDVIYISAESVDISEFTLQNSGIDTDPNDILNSDAGIDIQANNVEISNNIIKNNYIGLSTRGSSAKESLNVHNNIFVGNSEGKKDNSAIKFYACYLMYTDNSYISYNEFTENDFNIKCSHSEYVDISNNVFYDGIDEYSYALLIKDCHFFNINNNEIFSIYGGIIFGEMGSYESNNQVVNNRIYNTEVALNLLYCSKNFIIGNLFYSNNYGTNLDKSGDNTFYHNDYVNNVINAEEDMANIWYSESLEEGNFWDDYLGSDSNGDGIGDSPYHIPGEGESMDLFPLMMPVNNIAPSNPNVYGPSSGRVGEEQVYSICSNDLNDDKIFYYIDWGDGNFEDWIGPFGSGEEQSIDHTWDEVGSYNIRVRAKDEGGLISDWTELVVSMPKSKGLVRMAFFQLIIQHNQYLYRLILQFLSNFF